MQSSTLLRRCATTSSLALSVLLLSSLLPARAPAGPPPAAYDLAAPSGLTASAESAGKVHLTWIDGAGEEGYALERSIDGGWTFGALATLPAGAAAHDDDQVAACTQYCYRLRALGTGGPSPYSNVACATTPGEASTSTVPIIDGEDFEGRVIPPDWPETPWGVRFYGHSDGYYSAGYYAYVSSSSPGALRTPSFDLSDAARLDVSFWVRASLSGDYYYTAYLECDGRAPLTLESYASTGGLWQWKTYTIGDPALFSSSCAVAWDASIDSGGAAHLDLVTVAKGIPATAPPPTTIDAHPEDRAVCEGAAATFAVSASGADLTYRWQSYTGAAWQDLDATSPSLTIDPATASDDGRRYRCVVTGGCAVAYSHAAALHVTPATGVLSHPSDVAACAGEGASLSVVAAGSDLAYAWEFDDSSGGGYVALADGPGVSGASSPTLTLDGVDASRVGAYRCSVTGACGGATSDVAHVSLRPSTDISVHPQSASVPEGSPVAFSVSADGDGLAYAWEISTDGGVTFQPIPGATGPTYALEAVALTNDGAQYRCVVSGTCGVAVSEAATLVVLRVHEIPLAAGWNLISLPLRPVETDLSAVLAGVEGQYTLVYAWSGGGWLHHDPAATPPGDLTHLDETHGFWIEMNAPATLRVVGRAPTGPVPVPLAAGWSLCGYAARTPRALPGALADHGAGDALELVYAHVAGETDPWRRHDPRAPAWSNTLPEMAPGSGYWVRVASPVTWTLPPD